VSEDERGATVPVEAWKTHDVLAWLAVNDMNEFRPAFSQFNVTGAKLLGLLAMELLKMGIVV
jgi:hypothetical protein